MSRTSWEFAGITVALYLVAGLVLACVMLQLWGCTGHLHVGEQHYHGEEETLLETPDEVAEGQKDNPGVYSGGPFDLSLRGRPTSP